MAIGVNQGLFVMLTDHSISESTEYQGASVDVSLATEWIFWVQLDAASQDEASWELWTKMVSSDASEDILIDEEASGSGAFDVGDEFIYYAVPWANQAKTWDYDSDGSAGSKWTIANLSTTNYVAALEQIYPVVTSDATAGTYTFSAAVRVRG